MKFNRALVIPLVLAVYLAVMAAIGYPAYLDGRTSPLQYFGVIGLTILIIILLHFNLKRRERLRRERLDDMNRYESKENN